jgi:hypothetical protein
MNEPKTLQDIINDRADTEFMHKYMNDVHNFKQVTEVIFGHDIPAQVQSILESLDKAIEEPNNPGSIYQAVYLRKMKNRERVMMNFVYSIPKI